MLAAGFFDDDEVEKKEDDDADSWFDDLPEGEDEDDEVDDETFELNCPVVLLSNTTKEEICAQVTNSVSYMVPNILGVNEDVSQSLVLPKLESAVDEKLENMKEVPRTLPVSKPASLAEKLDLEDENMVKDGFTLVDRDIGPGKKRKQMSLSEAWNQKKTITASRRFKARSQDIYTFVYASIFCNVCCSHGTFRLCFGDEKYTNACLGNKWFDTEFIASFATLLAHDAHTKQPQYLSAKQSVQVSMT